MIPNYPSFEGSKGLVSIYSVFFYDIDVPETVIL